MRDLEFFVFFSLGIIAIITILLIKFNLMQAVIALFLMIGLGFSIVAVWGFLTVLISKLIRYFWE